MTSSSGSEFGGLFNDEELGEKVQFVDTVGSWLSLRILDYLYKNEQGTAGEVARGINMDMREVRGSLERLESIGAIESAADNDRARRHWKPSSSEISIKIRSRSGLDIDYQVAGAENQNRESQLQNRQANSSSWKSKVKRWLSALWQS
jgi:predicted ArsR family transcriptional regulator